MDLQKKDEPDIIQRLEFLLEDTATLKIYSTNINKDLLDAKEEIMRLRMHLSPPIS